MSPLTISVIIPTLNEEQHLAATVAAARAPAIAQIVVADGGSSDGTLAVARARADTVICTARGRARQMNAGAEVATGDVLMFLHADTLLPARFDQAIVAALGDARIVGGRFDVHLAPSSPLLWLTGELMNIRSRLSRIATGDQAIFVRRETFATVGGFSPIPLMEDIAFSRAIKRYGGVACLRERVITSARRWRTDGIVRTILLMWTLRLLYFTGVSPERLHRWYLDTR
jgi:rSAM/selenodomain-associated transferase 2